MQPLMFDAFECVRTSVVDAVNGEPMEPPVEDGESKKDWLILGFCASQSTLQNPKEASETLELIESLEEDIDTLKEQSDRIPADLEDKIESLKERYRDVDRSVYVLWGKLKKGMKVQATPPATKEAKPKPVEPSDPEPEVKE